MARVCTVCNHQEKEKIDELLIERQPIRNIAERFSLSPTSVYLTGLL